MATQQFERGRQQGERSPLREARAQAEDIMQSAGESATEFYEQATDWVQENYGKTIAVVTVLAAVGILGFMLGKSRSSMDLPKL